MMPVQWLDVPFEENAQARVQKPPAARERSQIAEASSPVVAWAVRAR